MSRTPPFHPIPLALAPIFVLYSRNVATTSWRETLPPLAVSLLATVAIWVGFRLAWRSWEKAAIATSTVIVLFFGFGLGVAGLGRLGVGGSAIARERGVLGVELVLGLAFLVAIAARPKLVRGLTVAANAGSLALVGLVGTGLVLGGEGAREAPAPVPVLTRIPLGKPSARRPDVYFLVLDAYGRSDVLRTRYGFDNRAFLDRLRSRGFVVADRGAANYCQTALSLASTLNARYLDDLAGSASPDRHPLAELIANSAVVEAFRSQGYRFVSFATGFQATDLRHAGRYLAPRWDPGPFGAMVARQTPLWLLLGQREARDPFRLHRERILHVFDHLPDLATDPAPTFCFAHVVAPHPPFVFGTEGRDVSAREGSYALGDCEGWTEVAGHGGSDAYVERYREQAAYVTARVEGLVERILALSPEPPVIVIQGDHGPGGHFHLNDPRPDNVAERMANLNAMYLPGATPVVIPETFSPVNTFRLVFDRYFDGKLGWLDDRCYHSTYLRPYQFRDVTEEVRGTSFAKLEPSLPDRGAPAPGGIAGLDGVGIRSGRDRRSDDGH
jgi:hypothetical protein